MIEAHAGQRDKADQPYVLHPLRVMVRCATEEERIVALLHDVVEDSDVTLEELRACGFSDAVVEAVRCLTKRDGESYPDFIHRVSLNDLATRVKIADLSENIDVTRLPSLTDADLRRIEKYHTALRVLERS